MYSLVELSLAESIEKTIRIENFLNSVKEQASTDDINIIRIYENVIKSIKKELILPSDNLKYYHGKDISDEALKLNINHCNHIFLRINSLHRLLDYIPNLQCRIETYTLLHYLLKDADFLGDKKIEPSVILSFDYNYAETNIGQVLEEGGIIESDDNNNQIILDIPKIEKDNPLMWTILAHEIGHVFDFNSLEVTNTIFKGLELPSDQLRILQKWTKEIVADIISIRIMGPAYLLSSIFFNLCLFNLENFSSTHPSIKYRISTMKSLLIDEFEMENIDYIISLFDEIQTFDGSPISESCEACGQELSHTKLENIEELIKILDVNVEKAKKIIVPKIKEFTGLQYNHSIDLSKNLMADIPINSSRELDDNILKDLHDSFIPNQDNIYTLLEKFEEKSNIIPEIISAGWINKIEKILPKFVELFLENEEGNFEDKYSEYRDFLNKKDNLLLKSIEIADIHSIFELGKNL